MIHKRPAAWTPFDDDERAEDEDAELHGEPLPTNGGAVVVKSMPTPDDAPDPIMDPRVMYDPRGPYATARRPDGSYAPGTSGNPAAMFRPGHTVTRWTHGERAEHRKARAPFADFEIDHAIAGRLRERLDTIEPSATDRLTLLARRVVSDAIAGRPYAVEACLDRLQPNRDPRAQERAGDGIVLVTQVLGPQGQEITPTVVELRSGLEDDDED